MERQIERQRPVKLMGCTYNVFRRPLMRIPYELLLSFTYYLCTILCSYYNKENLIDIYIVFELSI